MRELARIQFRGEAKEFIRAWNATSPLTIEQRVIALYKDEPDYGRMRQLFADFEARYNIAWVERVEVEYSEPELASFALLTLYIIGQAGTGNNAVAPVYAVKPTCQVCGRVEYVQNRNLVLNFLEEQEDPLELGYFQHDLCETDFHEVVVSMKVKDLIERNHVPGVTLRPIEHIADGVLIPTPYFQLLVEPQIGPLVEPTRIERLEWCGACGRYQQVLLDALPGTKENEFYFSSTSYAGQWIVKTSDEFGRVPKFNSRLIINQRFYRLLKESGVTGYRVEPAHLIAPQPS